MPEISNDYTYSQKICEGDRTSRQRFILEMSDHALWISKKWNNDIVANPLIYKTQTVEGKEVDINDEIADSWTWILKKIVKATCKFKGLNNASLNTFIYGVMNSTFTFNDWLKSKYGDTAYIPNIIRKLPEVHQKTYTLLKRRADINKICKELNIERNEAEYVIHEIKALLFKKGKGGMLSDKWVPIDDLRISSEESEDNNIENLKDIYNIELESSIDIDRIFSNLEETFNLLEKSDKRLLKLYWAGNLNAKQILIYIKSEKQLQDFKNLKFKTDEDVYKYIDDIISNCDNHLKRNKSIFYTELKLSKKIIKNSLKVLISNFELKQ